MEHTGYGVGPAAHRQRPPEIEIRLDRCGHLHGRVYRDKGRDRIVGVGTMARSGPLQGQLIAANLEGLVFKEWLVGIGLPSNVGAEVRPQPRRNCKTPELRSGAGVASLAAVDHGRG